MIRAPSRPPFSTSAGLLRPKSRSALAALAASPRTKAIATGPSNIDGDAVETGVGDRPAGQGVLEDLVLGVRHAQRRPQLGELVAR